MSYRVNIIIEKNDYGYYYSYSPDLNGWRTQAESLEEILDKVRKAMELYIETLTDPIITY